MKNLQFPLMVFLSFVINAFIHLGDIICTQMVRIKNRAKTPGLKLLLVLFSGLIIYPAATQGKPTGILPPPICGNNGFAACFLEAPNGDIYVGGAFNTANGIMVNKIARWDGATWFTLGGGMDNNVHALAFSPSGDLYAGGGFTVAGGVPANYIAKWDGSSWQAVGTGTDAPIESLAFNSAGELFAGGQFTMAGGNPAAYVAKYSGGSWHGLNSGMNDWVHKIVISSTDELYVGGRFTTVQNLTSMYITKWDGAGWQDLGGSVNHDVKSLAYASNGDLYAGGSFSAAGGNPAVRIAKWDGNNWTALGGGANSTVTSLDFLGNQLYMGGNFSQVDGVSLNFLSRWDNGTWSSIGGGTDGAVFGLIVTSSGNLVVGGLFNTAGTTATQNVAQWNGSSWSGLCAPCICSGPVTLTTQAEVNAFCCTGAFSGNLTIGPSTDITDLSPLNGITSVSGALRIQENSALATLSGLETLTSAQLLVIESNGLVDLNGLENLSLASNGFSLIDNVLLTDVSAMSQVNLGPTGSLFVQNNTSLSSLVGLESLSHAYALTIEGNDALVDLNGLQNVSNVDLWVRIINNGVQNLNGLQALISISDDLNIEQNDQLVDIDALSNLTNISGDLIIRNNLALPDVDGLSGVTSVENLSVISNAALTNLDGFTNLQTVGTGLRILSNANLQSCCGIYNALNNGPPTVNISGNPGCTTANDILNGCGDQDGDGYTTAQGDCDDTNPDVNPGATEICNGIDDNCDGQIDESQDLIPPVAICIPSISVELDESGNATLSASQVDNGSYDDCSPVTRSLNKTNFNCDDINAESTPPTANFLFEFGGTAPGAIQTAGSIALGPNGDVYLVDIGQDQVMIFDGNGGFLSQFGTNGFAVGEFANIRGIDVDVAGRIYVTDDNRDRVLVFDNTQTFLFEFGTSGGGPGQFLNPWRVSVSLSGAIHVVDNQRETVLVFDQSGTFQFEYGSTGVNPGDFDNPTDIAHDISGNSYVLDQHRRKVIKFAANGAYLMEFGEAPSGGNFIGRFDIVEGLNVDANGHIYVADRSSGLNNQKIMVFAADGQFIYEFGNSGTTPGQLNWPYSVDVLGNGHVYVSDLSRNRVLVFEQVAGISGEVTLTVTDESGNSSSCTVSVSVIDNLPPSMSAMPSDIMVSCQSIPEVPIITATDNCSAEISFSQSSDFDGLCSDYQISRTWVATDPTGNSVSHTQTITVTDHLAPVFNESLPGDLIVECGSVPAAAVLTAVDDCTGLPNYTEFDPSSDPSLAISGSIGSVNMTISLAGVTSAEMKFLANTTDNSFSTFANPFFTPTIPLADGAAFNAISGVGTITFDFATPVTNPILQIANIDLSIWDFSATTLNLVRLSGNDQFGVADGQIFDTDPATFGGFDSGFGSVQFLGTFTQITGIISKVDVGTDGLIFQMVAGDPNMVVDFTEVEASGICVGTYTITRTWQAQDGCGNSVEHNQTIEVADNAAPGITDCPLDISIDNDASLCGAVVTWSDPQGADACSQVIVSSTHQSGDFFPVGTTPVSYVFSDACGNSSTCIFNVTVADAAFPVPDVANLPDLYGCEVTVSTPTATDNCDGTIQGSTLDPTFYNVPGTYTIHWTYEDAAGNVAMQNQLVIVEDVIDPVITSVSVPLDPIVLGNNIATSGTFTDDCDKDDHSAVWDWGDGTQSNGMVDQTTHIAGGNHTYAEPGVYIITLTISDGSGNSDVFVATTYAVIYDPSDGFITGGGWIQSPPGAYVADLNLTGKANFGFVSKYKNGSNIPTGNTSFHLNVANFKFKSTEYDWLVIGGAKAKFKGSGKVNNQGDYGFMITGIDGQVNGGGGVDKFRIKIWDEANGHAVVYDNKMGSDDAGYDTQELGGGSITIHKQNGNGNRVEQAVNDLISNVEIALKVFPNPFREYVTLEIDLEAGTTAGIEIYDIHGRMVRNLGQFDLHRGKQTIDWDGKIHGGGDAPTGMYYVMLRTPEKRLYQPLLKLH